MSVIFVLLIASCNGSRCLKCFNCCTHLKTYCSSTIHEISISLMLSWNSWSMNYIENYPQQTIKSKLWHATAFFTFCCESVYKPVLQNSPSQPWLQQHFPVGVQCPFRQCLEHSDVRICAGWAVLLHSSGTKGLNKNTQTKQIVKSQGKGEKLLGFIMGLIFFYGIISGSNLHSKRIAFFSSKPPINVEMICYTAEKNSVIRYYFI